MADPFAADRSRETSPEDLAGAVERFGTASAEIRGCAIFGSGGVVAASGDPAHWADVGPALLLAADKAAGSRATHAHVATEEGEVFAVRSGELAMIAVTSRFSLASLVLADMRAALRLALAVSAPAAAEAA